MYPEFKLTDRKGHQVKEDDNVLIVNISDRVLDYAADDEARSMIVDCLGEIFTVSDIDEIGIWVTGPFYEEDGRQKCQSFAMSGEDLEIQD